MMLTHRPVTFTDVPAIGALERAVDVHTWGRPETEDSQVRHYLEWVGDLESRTLALVDTSDVIVGFAMVGGSGDGRGEGSLLVAPWLDDAGRAQVGESLMQWLVRARALRLDAPRQNTEQLELIQRHGFVPVRSSFELELADPATLPVVQWPAGVTLRAFDLDRDTPELHELIYSVWTDVPGHTARPFDEWRLLMLGYEGLNSDLQILAERDGRLVGAALCRIYNGTDGWVSQLVVGRAARGIGLGRALLVEALRRLSGAPGVELVGLSVMAENSLALGLYRSVGLEIDREFVVTHRADPAA